MPTTVQDVIEYVSSFVGENGVCGTDPSQYPFIIHELNGAIPLLMKRLDAKGTLHQWKQYISSQTFTLPYDCLEIRQAWLNNISLRQRDSFYQGELGVGIQCSGPFQCWGHDLIDLGDDFALPYDWPNHFDTHYGLVAESNADAGTQVTVRFYNRLGDLLTEQITLLPDQQLAITVSDVREVVFQSKGVTNGAIRGYIYYPQTNQRVWNGTFPSFVSIPRYRKKKLPHCFGNCSFPSTLVFTGKVRYFPVQNVLDEIPISDQYALGYACKALTAMKNSRFDEANTALTLGVNELDKQLEDESSRASITQIQVSPPFRPHAFSKSWR